MWHYTYILENERGQQYVGSTSNLKERLKKHNKGDVSYTAKFRPWKLAHAATFPTKQQALTYEKYLKSGSGTMFRYRHLVPNKRHS